MAFPQVDAADMLVAGRATVWCDDADEPLEKINTEEWLKVALL